MAYMGPAFNTYDVDFNFSDLVLDPGDIVNDGDLLQYDLANGQWLTVANLTIPGNLIVNGTTTTVNSTTITVDDPIFTLGGDTAPTADDALDRGIEFRWHDGAAAKIGFFGFDNSTGNFTYIPDATNTNEVFSGTPGSATFYDATFSGNTAVKLPVGTTLERPTALQGHIRYNTDSSQFEGYNGTNWSGLGGVIDVDQDTYISAETSSGTDNDELKFYTAGNLALTVTSSGQVKAETEILIDGVQTLATASDVTTAATQVAIDTFPITSYRSAKYVVQAVDTITAQYHVTELLVIHDNTTAYASEYGTVFTGTSPVATYDVDIDGTNFRLLATPATANLTDFKVTRSTINVHVPDTSYVLDDYVIDDYVEDAPTDIDTLYGPVDYVDPGYVEDTPTDLGYMSTGYADPGYVGDT